MFISLRVAPQKRQTANVSQNQAEISTSTSKAIKIEPLTIESWLTPQMSNNNIIPDVLFLFLYNTIISSFFTILVSKEI